MTRDRPLLLQLLDLLEPARRYLPRHFAPLGAGLGGFPFSRQPKRGRGVRPFAEDEAEEIVVTNAAQELQRLRVLLVRLARESANDVAGERDVWARLEEPLHALLVLRDRVPAAHALEHAVRAVLHGKMEMRHQLR